VAWNTKKWDTRLAEIGTTLQSLVTAEVQFDVPDRLRQAIDALSATQQKTLSNSLHLEKQNTEGWREWVRAYVLVEQVMVAVGVRRPVNTIVQFFNTKSQQEVRQDTRELIRSLDSWADWGCKDFAAQRPLAIGCSVSGGGASGPGTISCFVTDNVSGDAMLLTNQHVALQEHGNATGTALDKPLPDIYQPARLNGGTNNDKVGTFVRGFLTSDLDAAVCKLDNNIQWSNQTRAGGTQPSIQILRANRNLPQVGDLVWKCGCMSYISRGRVVNINKNSTVPHSPKLGGAINFTAQIEVVSVIAGREFQIPGDSGSGLFNQNNEIIGVMHGGTHGGGIATPIDMVFNRLNVDFA